jgi:molybdopterin/thiamine biosynthesis adenylyltransferase
MNGAAALVVGAGALGQNSAMNLALAGIGEIRIVDRDRFENHNRTRSPAYPLPEELERYGMDKARAVAGKLARMMTAPHPVMRYAHNWIQELGDGAFQGVSVVISCVDSQLARAYLSDKTRQHGLPFIEGGFEGPHISLTSFPAVTADEARATPCWRCSHPGVIGSFPCRNYVLRAEAAGIIPAVQNAAAVLGGLQAEAAALAIHSESSEVSAPPRSLSWNIRTWEGRTVNLARESKCPGVHSLLNPHPITLTTRADDTVEQLLQEIGEHLHDVPLLKLPMKMYAKLFWSAPCTSCGRMAAVHGPEWKWQMAPRCSMCGGPFPVLNGDAPSSPNLYPELSPQSNPEVLRATCRQIGLSPLALVSATSENSTAAHSDNADSFALFQLPGTLQELYEIGDTQ